MIRWVMMLIVAAATVTVFTEARAIQEEPISMMLDAYGNPIVFIREKRAPAQPYPQRSMMFTGYYRPTRRSHLNQATGVFAQGNAVSGEAFFGGMNAAPHLPRDQQPAVEPEISSAEAEAAPGPAEDPAVTNQEDVPQVSEDEPQYSQPENPEDKPASDEGQAPQADEQPQQDEQHNEDEQQHNVETEQETPQEAPEDASVGAPPQAAAPATPAKKVPAPPKKGKKTTVVVDDDEEDDEDDYEEDDAIVPFVPFKGSKRRQHYPNLNNFFPMVFSFPGASSRSGSSGSLPGTITAIANSYSTGKSGVANSVATAYGGSPNGKKRRTASAEK